MESSVLSEYLNKKVAVITTDGGLYIGYLEGYDHSTNLALRNTVQRTLLVPRESTDVEMGLFIIRGDCVSVVGHVEPGRDAGIDWERINAEPLKRFK